MEIDIHEDPAVKALLTSPLWEIMLEITRERLRQNEKWGEQNHDDAIWAAILGEEVGEVDQALLHDQFGGKAAGTLKTELIQAVAVGVQWLECIDRRPLKAKALRDWITK